MNIIVPAGRKPEWVPSEDGKLQKTASTEEGLEVQEEVNPLYEAAKGFFEAKEAEEAEAQIKEAGDDEQGEEAVVEVEEPEVEEPEASGSVADAVREVEEKAEAAEEKVEQVLEAVEGIGEAVDAAKDACSEIAGEDADEVVEVDIDIEDEGEGEELGGDDLVIESEPEVEACGQIAAEEASMDKAASAEEFCRYSMISGPNRKKLADYWINALGYPKDYVKLMVKDYE